MVQKERFFGKIIAQKRCKYQCFCFLLLVAMESVIFEFVGIYGVSCMCFHKTLSIPVSLRRRSKNTVKYSISDMLCCPSVANSGVLTTLYFLVLAKTS